MSAWPRSFAVHSSPPVRRSEIAFTPVAADLSPPPLSLSLSLSSRRAARPVATHFFAKNANRNWEKKHSGRNEEHSRRRAAGWSIFHQRPRRAPCEASPISHNVSTASAAEREEDNRRSHSLPSLSDLPLLPLVHFHNGHGNHRVGPLSSRSRGA